MNTLMMTLQQPISVAALAHCLGWGPARSRAAKARRGRRQRPSGRHAAAPAPVLDEADVGKGCGWFDSSRDLHKGLVVLEHNGVENLGADLPVTVWLSLVLDGTAGTAEAAQPAAWAVRA